MVTIDKRESEAINTIRFICILTVAMVHCYPPHSSLIANQLVTQIIPKLDSYFAASCFCEEALGVFFLISGYLFFRSTSCQNYSLNSDYLTKMKSRLLSLVLFYLVWTSVGFTVHCLKIGALPADWETFICGYWPLSSTAYTWDKGLWFIRSLIIFTLLSPAYYLAIKYLKHLIPLIILLLSLHEIPINFPYFNIYLLLGSYLACMGINLKTIADLFDWKISLFILLLLQILVKSGILHLPVIWPISVLLFLAVFMKIFLNRPLPPEITLATAFVYAAHFYPAAIFKVVFFHILPNNMAGYILNMSLSCVCTVSLCVLGYRYIISKSAFLNLLFGGNRVRVSSPQ